MDLVEVNKRGGAEVRRHPWELARFSVVVSLLTQVIKDEKEYKVLDIGCGDIFFVTKLSELFPQVKFYAIDTAFTDEMIQLMSGSVAGRNIELFKSLDDASTVVPAPANLVLLLDVVEHIEDDLGFLRMLHDHPLISEDTQIMITVPAFQSLFCSHDYFLGHYRRYTNKTLKKVIKKAGFSEKELGYFFLTLILPRVLQVWMEKIKPKNRTEGTTGLVEWRGGDGITKMMKMGLIIDYRITRFFKRMLGLNLPGLSNYVLCKKAA